MNIIVNTVFNGNLVLCYNDSIACESCISVLCKNTQLRFNTTMILAAVEGLLQWY